MHKESILMNKLGLYPLGTHGKKLGCFNIIIEIIGELLKYHTEKLGEHQDTLL